MPRIDRIISSDSHFVEPPEMWAERIDRQYRDRAPHLVEEIDGVRGSFVVCEDLIPSNGSGFLAAGIGAEDLPAFMQQGYAAAPTHMRDPAARIVAQDQDGVAAEVMYASYGMSLFHIEDTGLRDACFRAFNDWAADYCSYNPARLVGVGLIALDDIGLAVQELTRIAGLGLKGAMIWAEPPEELPYSHDVYNPFWSAAEDLDMKLSMHSLTSRRRNFTSDPTSMIYRSAVLYQEVVRSVTDMILNGVMETHPRLRVVSAENEIGWLPFHLWRMDQLYEKLRAIAPDMLSMPPSEYFYRQVFATFIEDPFFSLVVPTIGSKNIMWSSDFPHLASTFPHSRQEIEKNLGDLEDEDIGNIVHDNVASLYSI